MQLGEHMALNLQLRSQALVIYSLWPKWRKTQYDFWQIYVYHVAERETIWEQAKSEHTTTSDP